MRGRKALLVGLAVMLAFGAVWLVGCGGGSEEDAKAALRTALDKVEATIDDLMATMMAGGGSANVIAAKDGFGADWLAVVDAAKKVKGADAAAAEEAWTKLDEAFDALPPNATIMDLSATVLGPFTALQTLEQELRELAGPSE